MKFYVFNFEDLLCRFWLRLAVFADNLLLHLTRFDVFQNLSPCEWIRFQTLLLFAFDFLNFARFPLLKLTLYLGRLDAGNLAQSGFGGELILKVDMAVDQYAATY